MPIPIVQHPRKDCPWCWKAYNPATNFPVGRNARICAEHYFWMRHQLEAWSKMKKSSGNSEKD